MSPTWQEIVTEKRARQQASIPKEWILETLPGDHVLDVTHIPETCGLLTSNDILVTNSSVETLLKKLACGKWTAVEVTTAFSKRAIIAHQLTNCLTEIFIEKGLERARELDEYFKIHGKPVGPLHGLPISLKDQINIKGIEACMGYVSWVGIYPEKDSILVETLKALGAVFYVKTNIPQTLMWPETYNSVFGLTTNPHNRKLTSGGSSGGEGALIALRGSPLGVGSDIGGSIRIPSSFCGVYGFRPSTGRVPYAGCVNSLLGEDSVVSVLGPLSNSVGGLKTFIQNVVLSKTWLKDPTVHHKPWSEEEYNLIDHGKGKRLCFAVMWDDGEVVPHPPLKRALEMTKKALESKGHKVIDWKPHRHTELSKALGDIWAAGAHEDYATVTASTGEPVLTSMDPNAPASLVVKASFRPGHSQKVSAYQLWQVQKKKNTIKEEYLAHWNATVSETGTGRPVDAILCAPVASLAMPHGKVRSVHYTMVWNILDYPAAIVPVTRMGDEDGEIESRTDFYGDLDKGFYTDYKRETFWNAPVAIQIVGRNQEEEAVLGMSELVDRALKDMKVQA